MLLQALFHQHVRCLCKLTSSLPIAEKLHIAVFNSLPTPDTPPFLSAWSDGTLLFQSPASSYRLFHRELLHRLRQFCKNTSYWHDRSVLSVLSCGKGRLVGGITAIK